MRVIKMLSLFIVPCLLLCGCQVSGEVENQAYVLVLGLDRTEDGLLSLTARVPKIGKSDSDKGGEASGNSPYLTFTVAAPDWPGAMEALQQATPRRMNLSHIELLIASEALAGEAAFPALARQIAQTPHLYTTASFVICRGSAREFVEAGETIIGTRMSAELRAMLKHYTSQGYIPEGSFAEAVFAADSFYSDPVAIWGELEPGGDADDTRVVESPMKQRFGGTVLLRQGVFVRALSIGETQLLNLIRGRTQSFLYEWEGHNFELTPAASTRRRVDWNGEIPAINIEIKLNASEPIPAGLEGALEESASALIKDCQRDGCDPFGFGELAARHFLTVPEWLACGWRDLYAQADVTVRVDIK